MKPLIPVQIHQMLCGNNGHDFEVQYMSERCVKCKVFRTTWEYFDNANDLRNPRKGGNQ